MSIEKMTPFAQPEKPEEEQIKKAFETRERIASLEEDEMEGKEAARVLAEKENEFREKLKEAGTSKEYIDTLADMYSDETLTSLEKEKGELVDGLTGLRNRKALNVEIPDLLKLEIREGKNASVIMLDFDYFKKVNDTLGHAAGDQALQKLAEMIKNTARKSDFSFRYGGEEFTVFLPDTDLTGAMNLAEKIRANIESTVMKIKKEDGSTMDLQKTVSLGVAGTDQLEGWTEKDTQETLSILLNNADKALYESKETGRNKVTAFESA